MRRRLTGLLWLALAASSHGCKGEPDGKGSDDTPILEADAGDRTDDGDSSQKVDASMPPSEPPDGGSSVDARCAQACEVFNPLFEEACGLRESASSLAARGFRRSAGALAVELASTEPDLMTRVRALTGRRALYASAAGVLLIQRAAPDTLATLRAALPLLRELPVLTTAAGRQVVLAGRFVVRTRPSADLDALLRGAGARLVRPLRGAPSTYLAEVSEPMAAFDAVEKLNHEASVIYAEPSFLRTYERRAPAQDPLFAKQWHLAAAPDSPATAGSHIAADLAWEISEGASGVVIGIYDDGVDFEHPDLKAGIVPGMHVPEDLTMSIKQGCCQHGTAVAGVAAAQANDQGGRGVCPRCALMPIFDPVLYEGPVDGDDGGTMMTEDALVAETFSEACKVAAVINNSWGPADGDPTVVDEELPAEELAAVVNDALTFCESQGRGGLGTVIVFAAGNGNESVASDPFVTHETTLAVAASDDTGRKAFYSDFGASIDVTAPSNGGRTTGIWTTAARGSGNQAGGLYMDDFGGTSSAAPVVAGLVGLVLSVNPSLTAAQVRQLLKDTSDKIDRLEGHYDADGFSPIYGAGRVNAYRAVREAERLAGTCKSLGVEQCNGVDDDCDGTVDEGCAKSAACEACTFDGACASGVCAQTPNDTEPRCLETCEDGACTDGFACQAGLCVPQSGRCAPPADELCNGIDDDLDGKSDEDACAEDAPCMRDDACQDGSVCVDGACRPTCATAGDCSEDRTECLERTDRYGRHDGTRICVVPFDPCLDLICTIPEDEPRAAFIACVESMPTTCDAAYACIPEQAF